MTLAMAIGQYYNDGNDNDEDKMIIMSTKVVRFGRGHQVNTWKNEVTEETLQFQDI